MKNIRLNNQNYLLVEVIEKFLIWYSKNNKTNENNK